MDSEIPSLSDISPTEGEFLDEKVAVEHFLGKTGEDAVALFRENSLLYLSDLMWMGEKAFAFYLPAFLAYLQSTPSETSPDDLNYFISIVKFRMEHAPQSAARTKETIILVIDWFLSRYSKLAVNTSIYGDLMTKLIELRTDFTRKSY